jgi:phosphatidylglycerol:prolipoprotein diacylglycerol transferase
MLLSLFPRFFKINAMDLLYITWNVKPQIFEIGNFELRWYGLLFMGAFIAGNYLMGKMLKNDGVPDSWLDKLLIYVLIGTVLGARLGHVFFYDWDYYSQNLGEILMVWKGGLASHGAAIGIILSVWLFSKNVSKKPTLWALDRVVIVVALAGLFIRMGNLMNSEIIGTPSEVPWAFIFERVDGLPRHPVQIYEALAYSLIFIFLYRAYWKGNAGKKIGWLFGMFLIGVFGARFILEYFKHSQGGFENTLGLFSTGQWLSIPFALIGFYFVWKANKTFAEKA